MDRNLLNTIKKIKYNQKRNQKMTNYRVLGLAKWINARFSYGHFKLIDLWCHNEDNKQQ